MRIFKNLYGFLRGDIVMYSDSFWSDCQEAKSFFVEHGLGVKIKNIEDEKVKQEMKRKYNRVMVPTILIKDKIFIGFHDNKEEIKLLLNIK